MINLRAVIAGVLIGFFGSMQFVLAEEDLGAQDDGNGGNQVTVPKETEEPIPPDCSVPFIQNSFDKAKNSLDITSIQFQLKAGGYLTDQVDGLFGTQTYHALARLCQYLTAEGLLKQQEPLERAAGSARGATSSLAELLTKGLEQTASESGQTSKISLDAGDCGCSRDFSALSYGFLPYWLVDGSAKAVDFSVLDRIGFHGLQFKEGKIINDSRWSDESNSGSYIARFINTAHRHRVKVDVTYYTSDWMNWEPVQIRNAVNAIGKSINQEFRDDSRDDDSIAVLGHLLRKLLPFVEDNSTVRADGINLYFDSYDKDSDAPKLRKIVKDLHKVLQQERPDARLNITLGLDWSGINTANNKCSDEGLRHIDKKLFSELEGVLAPKPDSDTDPESYTEMIDQVFVFLPIEHTSHAKKLLRRVIEDAFDGNGTARRTVLRKMVPIITTLPDLVPDNYFNEGEQFVEDLIYLQDNFAGVGLWPLPTEPEGDEEKDEASTDEVTENETAADDLAESHAEAIGARLIDVYGAGLGSGLLDAEIEFVRQKLCDFACPNRWLFRIAFDFLAALLVIYGLLAVWNCKLRKFYQRRTPYFLLYGTATALIFGVSLVCDPFWKQRENVVMLTIIVLLVAFVGVRSIARARQPRLP